MLGQNVTAVDATAPALEAVLYFQTSGQVKVGRMGYDPNVSRQGQNSFQTAGSASGCPAGKTYAFSTVVALNTLGVITALQTIPCYCVCGYCTTGRRDILLV